MHGTANPAGRVSQAFLHSPQIGQQLMGVGLEIRGERRAQIVIAPTTLGSGQAVPQPGMGPADPVA
ncbi:hypothetical protein GCM10027089_05320 [Nocardia thraciensis]